MFPLGAVPKLEALLRDQRARHEAFERASGRIVPWVLHRRGKPVHDFRVAWTVACAVAKVPRLFHDFRRTAVRNLERAGIPRS